jgi:2-polyprenyl-6-methoxyphenol hydroxylase-like FAD-dependent oxidoreductase
MPPYAGEGVNMAMLDALVLSRELLSKEDTADAIAAYEAEMFYASDASDRVVSLFQGFSSPALSHTAAKD